MADIEERPLLDAIEGWPHPSEQTEWLGDPAAEERLRVAYASGRMHHAWLIGGVKGVGKSTLAHRFARFAFAHPNPAMAAGRSLAVDPTHPAARKVAAGSHPNLLHLERDWDDKNKRHKTDLSVDQIRRIIRFFGSTPGEAGPRIAIIDVADDLNPNSSNALLKMLEDPPRDALLFVLAHVPGRALPTIRSRCVRLHLPPLAKETIAGALTRAGEEGSPAEIALAAKLAEGSLRRGILLLRGRGTALYSEVADILAGLPGIDMEKVHGLADRVSAPSRVEDYNLVLDLVGGWLSRRVRRENELAGRAQPSEAIAAVPLARWAEVWEKTRASAADADEYNLDRKQMVLSTFMTLARATRM